MPKHTISVLLFATYKLSSYFCTHKTLKQNVMSTTITLNMPEIALFEENYLKQLVSAFIKTLATSVKTEKPKQEEALKAIDWRNRPLSPEVMAMTFDHPVDLGTPDYKEILISELEEKYK